MDTTGMKFVFFLILGKTVVALTSEKWLHGVFPFTVTKASAINVDSRR